MFLAARWSHLTITVGSSNLKTLGTIKFRPIIAAMGYPTKPTQPIPWSSPICRPTRASIFRDSCLWNQSSRQQHLNSIDSRWLAAVSRLWTFSLLSGDEQLPPKAASSLVVFSSFMMRKECWKGQASRVAEWVYIVESLSYTVKLYMYPSCVPEKKTGRGRALSGHLGMLQNPADVHVPGHFLHPASFSQKKTRILKKEPKKPLKNGDAKVAKLWP